MVQRYRKRPAEVEVIRWAGDNWQDVVGAFKFSREVLYDQSSNSLFVQTPEGRVRCATGDYLVRNTHGEFSAYRQDALDEEFELI